MSEPGHKHVRKYVGMVGDGEDKQGPASREVMVALLNAHREPSTIQPTKLDRLSE
jgi:hypothetical protein